METDLPLVPGRECGDCAVCCDVLTIDSPQMQKAAGALCRHCAEAGGTGCAIYAARPPVCRSFFCGWRHFDFLEEGWRPDRSRVLIELETLDGQTALSLMLLADPVATVRQDWFMDFIAVSILNDSPLLLALPGPRGHKGAKLSLNTAQMKTALETARPLTRQLLEMAVAQLRAWKFEPWVFANRGNDAGM